MLRRIGVGIGRRKFFSGEKFSRKIKETGLFDDVTLQTSESLRKLPEGVNREAKRLLDELLQPGTSKKRTSLQIVDDLSNELCKSADLAECVRQLHNDDSFRESAEEASRDFCEIVENLNTNTALYQKLKKSEELEKDRLDDVDRRTLGLLLDDFEQSGVHLEMAERRNFVELSAQIFDSGARFQANCDRVSSVKKPDQVKFGLPSQIYTPISNSLDRTKRKMVYDTFYQHDDQQESNLRNLVSSRHQLAKLTGFESFAHRAQRNSLLETYESARDFLWGVVENCREAYERELAVLVDVGAQCDNHSNTTSIVAEHDLSFLMHLYKERAFDIDRQTREISHFFTISSVFRGFSTISERLYGVRLVEKPLKLGEMWEAESVFKMVAVDAQNNLLGTIYVDTSIRPEKAIGDCHYTVRCSKMLENGQWQLPILVLSLGLQDSWQKSGWRGCLVRPTSAETIFHELGHAMHSILGRTKYQHVAGTRCPQDFSEIPSNLMEYFWNDLDVMREILKRPEGGEHLPVEAAATVLAARKVFTAIETVQQAAYGLYDLEVHGPIAGPQILSGSLTTTELFYNIMNKAMPHIERSPQNAFQHRFHHTVQYGAKYYSYLVARASASLIWQQRFQADPFSRKWGECWAEVQSHGGGHHPSVLLEKILGFQPTSSDLTSALAKECKHLSNLDAITV